MPFTVAIRTQDVTLRAHLAAAAALADAELAGDPAEADVAILDTRLPMFRATLQALADAPALCIAASAAPIDGSELLDLVTLGVVGCVHGQSSVDDLACELTRLAQRGQRASEVAEDPDGGGAVARILEERSIEILFQPICDLHSGHMLALNATPRFTGFETRAYGAWLEAAAREDLRAELEIAVAEEALGRIEQLPPGTSLWLPVSADVLLDGRLTDLIAQRGAGRTILELSNHAGVDDYEQLSEALTGLRGAGAWIAVDDSGTGLHSLARLSHLRPDFVTIHQALVRSIDRDEAKRSLTASMIAFVESTGAQLIAAGVDTEGELEVLRELGIGLGQGYLLAASSTLEDIPEGPLELPAPGAAVSRASSYSGPRFVRPARAEGDFRATTQAVMAFLRTHLPDDSVVLTHLDYASRRVGIIAAVGAASAVLEPGQTFPQADTPEYWLASGHGPRICPDVKSDPVYGSLAPAQHPLYNAYMGTPLELMDGTRFGVLSASSARRGAFDADHLAMLEEIAVELERAVLEETETMSPAELMRFLRGLSQTDGLTNALNRSGFAEALDSVLQRPKALGTHRFLVSLEVESLGALAERCGRTVCDLVVKDLAVAMRACSNSGDSVGRIGEGRIGAVLVGRSDSDADDQFAEVVSGRLLEMARKRDVPLTLRYSSTDLAEADGADHAWELAASDSRLLHGDTVFIREG
ncbi:MAG: EAL domain-containing protein [Solirubrobacteraceae bacterium]|nr:EAL domain-containing protein [Solirubrobacteraceae bacterium]